MKATNHITNMYNEGRKLGYFQEFTLEEFTIDQLALLVVKLEQGNVRQQGIVMKMIIGKRLWRKEGYSADDILDELDSLIND